MLLQHQPQRPFQKCERTQFPAAAGEGAGQPQNCLPAASGAAELVGTPRLRDVALGGVLGSSFCLWKVPWGQREARNPPLICGVFIDDKHLQCDPKKAQAHVLAKDRVLPLGQWGSRGEGLGSVFASPSNECTLQKGVAFFLSPQRKVGGSRAGSICAATSLARHSLCFFCPLTGASASGSFSRWPAKDGWPGRVVASLPSHCFQPRVGNCLGSVAADECPARLCDLRGFWKGQPQWRRGCVHWGDLGACVWACAVHWRGARLPGWGLRLILHHP